MFILSKLNLIPGRLIENNPGAIDNTIISFMDNCILTDNWECLTALLNSMGCGLEKCFGPPDIFDGESLFKADLTINNKFKANVKRGANSINIKMKTIDNELFRLESIKNVLFNKAMVSGSVFKTLCVLEEKKLWVSLLNYYEEMGYSLEEYGLEPVNKLKLYYVKFPKNHINAINTTIKSIW